MAASFSWSLPQFQTAASTPYTVFPFQSTGLPDSASWATRQMVPASAPHWLPPYGPPTTNDFTQPAYPYSTEFPARSPVAGRGLRHTFVGGRNEPGCVVAAMAMVANVSYTQARGRAASLADFNGNSGMFFSSAQKVLSDLGIAASWHVQGGRWSDLPDRAIVGVTGPGGVPHAVVFDRDESGNEYLYDWNYRGPVPRQHTDYNLMDGGSCLHL